MKCNQSRPGFELESPCSFPTTITTTPRAPPLRVSLGNPFIPSCATWKQRASYITIPLRHYKTQIVQIIKRKQILTEFHSYGYDNCKKESKLHIINDTKEDGNRAVARNFVFLPINIIKFYRLTFFFIFSIIFRLIVIMACLTKITPHKDSLGCTIY